MRKLLLLLSVLAAAAPLAVNAQEPQSVRAASPTLDIGGAFSLSTHNGQRLTDADLKGKPYALFFGFTHCPEVCPTTLFELTGALATLGADADKLAAFFVTVDPERDTQEHLASYLGAFDDRIIGLRGTDEETAAIARSFKATYRKIPLDGGDYTMDHTAVIYLMDREGRFFDKIDYREDHKSQLEKLRRLLASG